MEKFQWKKTSIRNFLIVFLLWGFASLPLFGQRFIPTHDGEYHLIRIYEFSKMLRQFDLFPRWAPGLNSGYGFPLFIFHYPFPNYIGSFFYIIGFPLVQSFQMSLALGYLFGAVATYYFLKKDNKDATIALLGSGVFLVIPYIFVDVYIRGSIGEIWGIAFAVCALASIVRNKGILVAVSIGFMIISHNIISLIMFPVLLLYSFFFYRRLIPFIFLGVLLMSYFWIPALLERSFVVGLNSVTYSDHFPTYIQLLFPSWGSVFSQPGMVANEVSQQIGLIPLSVLILAVWYLIKNRGKKKKMFFFTTITALYLFLLLPISDPIWQMIPIIQYIQYPWRLLSILLVTIPVLFHYVATDWKPPFRILIFLFAVIASYSYMKPVTYEPRNDEYYLNKKEFTDGTSSMGNSFSTIWTPWIKERSNSTVVQVKGKPTISMIQDDYKKIVFDIDADEPSTLRIARTYYPGWNVVYNTISVPIDYNSDGILKITVPQGKGRVTVQFGETKLRLFANSISVLALSTILVFSILSRRYAYRH